jgi:spore coat polysaccharide biosynthesis predicted glycosyltransferase SpsG
MVRQFRAQPAGDYLVTPPDANGNVCLLEGVQAARRRAWQHADEMSNRPEQREHQFPVITRNPDRFRRAEARLDGAVYGSRHRLSVDTWADLEFMQTLHRHLAAAALPFRLPEAVRLLEQKPELKQINGHVYQRRLIESIHRVLFVVDAGGPYGYGHFMRCRELAGQLVERLSWPVTFLVDDERAAQMAEACGFRVLWGALGRPAQVADSDHDGVPPHEAAESHGLVVVDVSVQRELARGWRKSLASDQPVVVVDREDAMATEVDLILYPGVTGRASSDRAGLPPVVEGLEHVILRREVQRYQGVDLQKDIDLLVYLYDDAQKAQVQRLASEHGWRIAMPLGFSEEFPELLARSRVYLSGYGHSFYEALAVGTHPVAWPMSPSHRADAQAFYRAAGLPEALVEDAGAITQGIGLLLNNPACLVRPLRDGTPAVVRRLAALREAWG